MVYAGLDVHKRCTQICLEDESGALLERRILTERRRLLEEFGGKPPMRILLESATESEWVARCLESAGHEVIVMKPPRCVVQCARYMLPLVPSTQR
jgi:transposase